MQLETVLPQPIYFEAPRIELASELQFPGQLGSLSLDRGRGKDIEFFSRPAPNVIEWVTDSDYWNVPSTFQFWGQYQLLRDFFNLRCPLCNSQHPDAVDCWGKSKMYLQSEVLLVWNIEYEDFVCPKCHTTMHEMLEDGIATPYNELVAIVGMRSGKSFTGAHIGGYLEHLLITRGISGKGQLQASLRQPKSEWLEMNFAASTATQARKTIYAKYREMRNNSPWIKRYMEWVRREEKCQTVVDKWKYGLSSDEISDGYLQVRFNRVASDSSGVAGATRFAAFLDEWARLVDTEGTRSAWELYRVLNQGLQTIRSAALLNPRIPYFFGLMTAITSPIADDDPAMQTYNKAKDGLLARTFYVRKSTWEFNPLQPREAFDDLYAADPVGAERDFGANPPAAATPFIEDTVRFWRSIEWDRKPVVSFDSTYHTDPTGRNYIGANLGDCGINSAEIYYLFGDAGASFDCFCLVGGHPRWVSADTVAADGEVEPDTSARINPLNYNDVVWPDEVGIFTRPDRGGDSDFIAKMHQERIRMLRYNNSTPVSGRPYDHRGEFLATVVDFCLRIVPTQDRDVWFDSITSIISQLQKKIRVVSACFDRWQSESTQQQIRSMGIQSYPVVLKPQHFLQFRTLAYNGRVFMLPPAEDDRVTVTDSGNLIIGSPQETMSGEGIALVELLKLSRSPDLKKVYNPNKGRVRGKDSDDMAHCIVGLNAIIQNSIVDDLANTKKKKSVRKRLLATENPMSGTIFKGKRGF